VDAHAHDFLDLYHVGHALLGRRNPGADLQPEHPKSIGINALCVAPHGATPEFFHKKGMNYPP